MKTKCIGMFLPALLIVGCMNKSSDPGIAQAQSAGDAVDAAAPSAILPKLHALNQSEIQAGQLASTKACNAQVKQYGQTLVNDHTSMDQQVTQMAQNASSSSSAAGSSSGSSSGANGSAAGANGSSSGANGSSTGSASGANGSSASSTSSTTVASGPSTTVAPAATTTSTSSTSTSTSTTVAPAPVDLTSQQFSASEQQSVQQNQADLTRIAAITDCSFDAQFLQAMVTAHQFAIQVVTAGENSPTRSSEMDAFLQTTLADLQRHLSEAQQLLSSVQSANQSAKQSSVVQEKQ